MVFAIARRELLGHGRKARYFLLRSLFLGLLALVTISALSALVTEMRTTPGFQVFSRGLEYTLLFGTLQLVFVVVVAPLLSITALTREKTTGILELLFVAGTAPADVVVGKLAARALWLALCIASGLPLLAAGTLMGGAGFEMVALIVAHTVAAGLLGSAVGIFVSGAFRNPLAAFLGAAALQFVFYAVPFVMARGADPHGNRPPPEILLFFCGPQSISYASVGTIPSLDAWAALLPPLLATLLIAIATISFARPALEKSEASVAGDLGVALLEGSRAEMRLARSAMRPSRPVVGNPVSWREARSHRYGFWSRILRLAYLCIGGASAVHVLVFSVIGELPGLARLGVGCLSLGAATFVLVLSTTAISAERESQVLPLLHLSRLSVEEILFGKLEGLLRFLWPVLVLPVIPAAAFLNTSHTRAFLLALVMTSVLVLSAAAIGFFVASFVRSASLAVGIVVGGTLAWICLTPIVALKFPWNLRPQFLAAVNPIAMVSAILSSFAREPEPPPQYRYYHYRDPFDFSGHEIYGWIGIGAIAAIDFFAYRLAAIRMRANAGDSFLR